MPRESTRWTPSMTILKGGIDFEVQERGSILRVTLLGELDRATVVKLKRWIAPRLVERGRRIVLDGRGLRHIDYRAVGPLIAWSGQLRGYGHQLLLSGWSSYLKTILLLGDMTPTLDSAAVGHRSAS
jgi:anti-anti-sigma factor